ncbi:MAG: hypothetical protein Q7U75_18375 [Desulfobacterales bacterium]|nr:hypothetical protein [Desulfobacterales bacterium]
MKPDTVFDVPLAPDLPQPPLWWTAGRDEFGQLLKTRSEIHNHDRMSARNAQQVMTGTVLTIITIYSADAAGAMAVPGGPNLLLVIAAGLLILAAAWILNYRLTQQLYDVKARAHLWLDLVDAVRRGCVARDALAGFSRPASEVEELLRQEAALAARCVDSRGKFEPHLPVFGNCFDLKRT